MVPPTTIEQGREAFRQRFWADAFDLFSTVDSDTPLDPDDLERFARAAYLIGKEAQCIKIWTRTHQAFQDQGDLIQAVYCAFWLGFILLNRGDHAQGKGWMRRARHLLDECGQECAEQGFLLIPEALQSLRKGDTATAYRLFSQAADLGQHFGNPDLSALGRLGSGQALIRQGEITDGTALFDEAMVAVVSGEVSPMVAGIVYCAVIDICQKISDLGRAQEWTSALSHWCDAQHDMIAYRGQCLVRRAEVMQLHGQWPDAMNEARRASELSPTSKPPAAGAAFYRQAELFRLQGKFSKAEELYQEANNMGQSPQPGLALLRLAQDRLDAAVKTIRRVEEEKEDNMTRSKILPAFVEIMLSAEELEAAQTATEELSDIAVQFQAPFLQAIAMHSEGAVLLESGEPRAALDKLLAAWSMLEKIDAPYESARTRVLIGCAYRELDDIDSAEMELHAARWMFQELGATHDVNRVNDLIRKDNPEQSHGLTSRELEVLHLLATGMTNKSIAADLHISERTVDRHVSNILSKLNVPSRAAATAYAYEHNMV